LLLRLVLQELETQLLAASKEKIKVQSKYHELSIKHRQLIETSPQVATIWNEVLQQQHASGTSGDSAAMQRLSNFDLRHTGANSGMVMPVATVQLQQQQKRDAVGSPRKLASVNAATAIFSNGGPVAPGAWSVFAGYMWTISCCLHYLQLMFGSVVTSVVASVGSRCCSSVHGFSACRAKHVACVLLPSQLQLAPVWSERACYMWTNSCCPQDFAAHVWRRGDFGGRQCWQPPLLKCAWCACLCCTAHHTSVCHISCS
jgi:hypothetical protein